MKMVKFDLPIDGVKVSSLDELREHLTTEIIEHYRSGLLVKWLRSRGKTEELAAVEALAAADDVAILKGLCDVFRVEADDAAIAAAVATATGIDGVSPAGMIANSDKFISWLASAMYFLTRHIPPEYSPDIDYKEYNTYKLVSLAPSQSDSVIYWHGHLEQYINFCLVINDVIASCPDKAVSAKIKKHISTSLQRATAIYGMTKPEWVQFEEELSRSKYDVLKEKYGGFSLLGCKNAEKCIDDIKNSKLLRSSFEALWSKPFQGSE